MKEHPILFSAEMVRAILSGDKTQTRRVITPQPSCQLVHGCGDIWDEDNLTRRLFRCKYGCRGDRLWVREKFAVCDKFGETTKWKNIGPNEPRIIQYAADNQFDYCGKWSPSIHMPRWASRITLEITDIRVERVQDISDEDAKAEGVSMNGRYWGDNPNYFDHRPSFQCLWNSINEKRGYGWASNPWVWCVDFKRV